MLDLIVFAGVEHLVFVGGKCFAEVDIVGVGAKAGLGEWLDDDVAGVHGVADGVVRKDHGSGGGQGGRRRGKWRSGLGVAG